MSVLHFFHSNPLPFFLLPTQLPTFSRTFSFAQKLEFLISKYHCDISWYWAWNPKRCLHFNRKIINTRYLKDSYLDNKAMQQNFLQILWHISMPIHFLNFSFYATVRPCELLSFIWTKIISRKRKKKLSFLSILISFLLFQRNVLISFFRIWIEYCIDELSNALPD